MDLLRPVQPIHKIARQQIPAIRHELAQKLLPHIRLSFNSRISFSVAGTRFSPNSSRRRPSHARYGVLASINEPLVAAIVGNNPLHTQCYVVGPMTDVEDGPKGFGAHSDQERILVEALHTFVKFHYDAAIGIAGASGK